MNISYSALHSGIEWNYRLEREKDEEAFKEFTEEFNDLYNNYSVEITDQILKSYTEDWIKPSISREVDKVAYIKKENKYQGYKDNIHKEKKKPKPRGAQIDALYELKLAREEGYQEGIVAAATGVGKTYLAAFDFIDYDKILFVAHRMILIT